MMAKDLFSQHAEYYARYRPVYPAELFDHILQFVPERNKAWDCGTGNGQAARSLAHYFKEVEATDISPQQLEQAAQHPHIRYTLCPAEQTPFPPGSFDLITIATAYHWLDHEAFHREATRVGKPGAVIAAWAYNLLYTKKEGMNAVIRHFYKDITAPYWDPGRHWIDESYVSIPFDYELLPTRNFTLQLEWTREQFTGYLLSWSAVQTYIRKNGSSPVALINNQLDQVWEGSSIQFYFPLFLKIGRIRK